MKTPPQSSPDHLLKVGVKAYGMKFTPFSLSLFNSFESLSEFINGAPIISKGLVVPLPSDILVPSRRTVPGYM